MADAIVNPRAVAFDAGGVSGTIRPVQTGRDAMFRSVILRKLYQGLLARGDEWRELVGTRIAQIFGSYCICASGVTGFTFPAVSASVADITDAFIAWLDLDIACYDGMVDAFDKVNAPTNDPALVPPDQLTDEKKENSATPAPDTGEAGMSA
jgi:hypothetical protein